MVQHIRVHLNAKHKNEEEVFAALSDTSNFEMSLLRARGDDKHNCTVIQEGKGCLLIFRRPTKDFQADKYGPCLHCREWMLKSTIKRHQPKCIARRHSAIPNLSKRNLIMQSDIISGRLKTNASDLMKKEVFPIMMRDNVTEVAQNDFLITALGESWLRRNIDNKLKRKYYASQRMRLNARLLIELRKSEIEDASTENFKPDNQITQYKNSMWEFLVTNEFDTVAKAAIQVAMPFMDDEEELKAPSNAIKLKYDIQRMINAKWSFALKQNNQSTKCTVSECKGFLQLMNVEWSEKVTKFARMVLAQRQREKTNEIPSPEDIKNLNNYLSGELKTTPIQKELPAFQRAVRLAGAKLLLYNKRRSGTIDGISLRDYAARHQSLNDVDESLVGDLTDLEKYLLNSQELMKVRGKGGRPVPCLIPEDVQHLLAFISNQKNRDAVGILKTNRFLFPNKENGAARSYESVKTVCSEVSLKSPERITSVNLRKYTATLTQVINLKPNEMQWVCSHLGHTKRVHIEHYRQMSGFIERVQISKLLLMQDMNLTKKFVGKSLESIQFEDIVQSATRPAGSDEADTTETTSDVATAEVQSTAEMQSTSYDFDDEVLDEDDEKEMDECEPRKKKMKTTRKKWSCEEEKELKKYFSTYLETKTTPKYADCERIKKKSKLNGGELYERANHLIIKKISAMNHKH